jgi:AcrR family transcriptional regulator
MVRTSRRGKYDRAITLAERREQRIEAVLDAATEVFAARGYAQTRVEDIVAAAGVSRRTLYEDFESVEAILQAVYDRAVRINFTTIVERLTSVVDPLARVEAGVATYFEMIAGNPAAARVVFEEYRNAGVAQAARYELNTTRYATLMQEFLMQAHVAGRLRRAPDETGVYSLIKGIEAVGMRALHRGEHAQLPKLAPAMAKLIIDAFGGAR